MRNFNVIRYLKGHADQRGDKQALIMEKSGKEASLTFRDLWDRVDAFSVGLKDLGLSPGDRMIVMIPMSVELYIVLLGIIKAGCVAVFVDPWISLRQVAAFCDFARPKGFAGVAKSHLIRLMKKSLLVSPVSITTGYSFLGIPAKASLDSILKRFKGDGDIFQASSGDSALVTFTSGSSGLPKGANRTHGFLTAQYQALQSEFHYSEDDRDMPMFPVFALNNMAQGIPSVIPDMDFRAVTQIDAAKICGQMQKNRITTCTASPPFFDRLAEYVQRENKTLGLKRILTGGAPAGDDQLRTWKKAFPKTHIEIVYGSTEAEPVSHISVEERLSISGEMGAQRPGYCMGNPTEVVESRIIRITPKAVPTINNWSDFTLDQGEVGELIVTGDHVCKDYFNNPEAVAQNKITDKDGKIWHRMGDTGYMDEKGRFWLVGRVHSTISRNGEMLHAQNVEQRIQDGLKTPLRVAALGLQDAALGEKLVLVVEQVGKEQLELIEKIKKSAETSRVPVDEIKIIKKKIPVDPRHKSKIDYLKLRRMI